MQRKTPPETPKAIPTTVSRCDSINAMSLAAITSIAPIGHIAAKPALTACCERRDQPLDCMSVVIDSASRGLCNAIAKNTPKPDKPKPKPKPDKPVGEPKLKNPFGD